MRFNEFEEHTKKNKKNKKGKLKPKTQTRPQIFRKLIFKLLTYFRMGNKEKIILTFWLDEEARLYLAKSGIIRYKDGRGIKFGEISKIMNFLVKERFGTTQKRINFFQSKLLDLEEKRKISYQEAEMLVEEIRKLKGDGANG